MQIAYVAGPYSDSRGHWYVHQNILEAESIALELWKLGYAVYCPHKNTAWYGGALDQGGGEEKAWYEGDLEFVRRSDIVVLMPRWRASKGAIAEESEARSFGIPVYLWPDVPRAK